MNERDVHCHHKRHSGHEASFFFKLNTFIFQKQDSCILQDILGPSTLASVTTDLMPWLLWSLNPIHRVTKTVFTRMPNYVISFPKSVMPTYWQGINYRLPFDPMHWMKPIELKDL